jgi:hypothetical protein
MPGVSDRAGPLVRSHVVHDSVAFRLGSQRRHPGLENFRGSIPGLRVPLSLLRLPPHGDLRLTRGRRGLLTLRRTALSSTPPCRFIPAHDPAFWITPRFAF